MDAGDILTYSATLANNSPLPIWLSFNPITRVFSGTPTNSDVGSLDIKAIATDTAGVTATDTFTLTVTNVNAPPTLSNISKTGNEDTVVSFNVNDFTSAFHDIDGDTLNKIKIISLPTNGTLKLGSTNVSLNQEIVAANLGDLTFTPNPNFNGSVSFGWNASDNVAYATTDAIVNLTLNPVNDLPTLNQAIAPITVNEDAANTLIDLSNVFSDADGDTIIKSIVPNSNNSLVTVSLENNNLTLEYLPNQFGSAQITVRGTANGQFVEDTFTLTVNGVNDSPTVNKPIEPQILTTNNAFSFTIPSDTFSDVDTGDTLRYTINNDSTFTLTNRTVTGTPTQTGTKTLTLIATDSQGLTAQTSIQLNIFNPVTGATNGDNTLTGGDGDDLIDARDGRDNVTGGKGNDRIVGGSGADVLGGGEGRDTFVYSSIRDSGDRLTDFDVNQDYLDFSALLDSLNYTGSNPVTDGYILWRTLGTGTLISVDSDGTAGRGVARPFITLDGVNSSTLTINNFVF